MSYTVGLDFGTHQTKICIEDASNPAQKTYEFFEFEKPDGNKTVFLPSIVQINIDDTLSYGFVEESQCKTMPKEMTEKPVMEVPQKPNLIYPPKPTTVQTPPKPKKDSLRGASMKEQLLYQQNFSKIIDKWELECKIIEEQNNKNIENWQLDCIATKNDYDYELEEYNREIIRLTADYNFKLKKWEADNLPQKQIFRYFKLASYSSQFREYNIDPKIISVWYLTFVILNLQEKIGNEFYTQMGYPCNNIQANRYYQEKIAYDILLAANMLASEYRTLNNFLDIKYTDLLKNTNFFEYNDQDLIEYGLNVIPEAFAGLFSLTKHRRIDKGMHLLVDIGGGTSDIAFFTINEYLLPDIHAVVSFPQGLNYIFDEFTKDTSITIPEAQQLFTNNPSDFLTYVSKYQSHLMCKTNSIIDRVYEGFIKRQPIHKISTSELNAALKNNIVVYCGGGSTYNCMTTTLRNFTDVRMITKEMLNIPYIMNRNIDDSMYTILATSYGLSIPMEEKELKLTDIEHVFDVLISERVENGKQKSKPDYDYGILDT